MCSHFVESQALLGPVKWSNDFNDVLFCEISIQFLQRRAHSESHFQSLGHFWVLQILSSSFPENCSIWGKVFLSSAFLLLSWLITKIFDLKRIMYTWRKEKEKIRSRHSVLIDIWEKCLLICFHWKHLFKSINVFLVPLLFRGKAYIVWNSNSWEFPVATKNATWRCFLRREQPIESSCRILGMPSLNKQTHSRKNNRQI